MTDSNSASDSAATDSAAAANSATPAAEGTVPAPAAVSGITMDVWAPPGAFDGPAGPPETEEERRVRVRRRRTAAVRWGAAVLVLGLVGVETAVAVTTMDRTDLPGLATPADGRYTFPAPVLPPLPSGRPAPGADGRLARHYADLRYLLLPAPKEAVTPAATATAGTTASAPASGSASPAPTATATASGSAKATAVPTAVPTTGPTPGEWAACDALADDQRDPAAVKAVLAENACRAGAVREWTATDGTKTQIRLLHFGSADEAAVVSRFIWTTGAPKLEGLQTDPAKDFDSVVGVASMIRSNAGATPGAPATARVGYLVAGDVIAVIEMTNPRDVPAPAFRQVVTLQSDLLA